jgi:hypothetical protein
MKSSQVAAATAAIATLPSIGARWPGIEGKYAGIARGEDGEADHHLVLLDARPALANWKDAMAAAVAMGADLPTRSESALLYANLRDEFDATRWHWTKKQYSSDSAWSQDFYDGSQGTGTKEFEALWRPVRRFSVLQSFNPSSAPQQGDVLQAILAEIQGARADVQAIFLADVGAA